MKTKVIFRKYPEGDIIALFPEVDEGGGNISTYMHMGQHARASYRGVVSSTKLAKPSEYASLKYELERAPYRYDLKVVKRATRARRSR